MRPRPFSGPQMVAKDRTEWEAMEERGKCPVCGGAGAYRHDHTDECPKGWYDWGFTEGYHDGANSLEGHDCAFLMAMLEAGWLKDSE